MYSFDGLALHHSRGAGEEAEVVDDDWDLVDGGADRLAGVLRLEATELVGARLECVGELEEHPAALGRGRVLPGLERRGGGVGGAVHVLRARRLDLGDDLAVGRVLDVERLAGRGVDPLAADELLVGLDALEDVGHRGPSWVVIVRLGWLVDHRTARRKLVPSRGRVVTAVTRDRQRANSARSSGIRSSAVRRSVGRSREPGGMTEMSVKPSAW